MTSPLLPQRGNRGLKGDKPAHVWAGTTLSFENPDGTYSDPVQLRGPQGNQGSGLEPDAIGTLAGRDTYDDESAGFIYLRAEDGEAMEYYVKDSATSGDWIGPFPVADFDYATIEQATVGTDAGGVMNPARTTDAIRAKAPIYKSEAEVEAATIATVANGGPDYIQIVDGSGVRSYARTISAQDLQSNDGAYWQLITLALGISAEFVSVDTASATTIGREIKYLRTQFYSPLFAEPATLVGGAHYRRTSSEPSHAGKFRSQDRFDPEGNIDSANGGWWELAESVIKPQHFGADPTGSSDATAAINNAISYMRDVGVYEPTVLGRRHYVDGAGGLFRVDGSINATGIVLGRNWGIRNLLIDARCSGKVALDLTGSRFGHLSDIHIWGDEIDTPYSGIQFAVAELGGESDQPCSHFLCDNVSVDGYYLNTAYHNYAGEEHLYNWCRFWNRRVGDGSGESWAAILDGTEGKSPISDFQTISTGRNSFTVNHYNHCSFQKPFGIVGPTMFWQDLANQKFTNCYITNGGGAAIVWRLTDYVPYSIDADFQVETTGNDTFINFTGDAAADRTISNFTLKMGNVYTEDQFFLIDTITGLTLKNFFLDIPRWNGGTKPTNSVFPQKSIVTIEAGTIRVPEFNDLDDPLTYEGFSGFVSSYDNVRRNYGELLLRRGQLTLSDGMIQTQAQASISDESVLSIPLPTSTTAGTFFFWSRQANVAAMIMYRSSSTPIILLSQLGSSVDATANTTLNGTAGTDGKVTISVNSAEIQIECRLGFTCEARWQFIAR